MISLHSGSSTNAGLERHPAAFLPGDAMSDDFSGSVDNGCKEPVLAFPLRVKARRLSAPELMERHLDLTADLAEILTPKEAEYHLSFALYTPALRRSRSPDEAELLITTSPIP